MVTGKKWLMFVIVAVTLLRLGFAPRTELIPEEAYYWTYAQHPALGYFDHPPMVAWTVALGTRVLGNTELGVRLINSLLWVATCFLVLATARRWFEERVAVGAALLFVAVPVYLGIGFLVTPDGPLIFFWALALYAITRAVQTTATRYWWLAGVAFGGAMLSKYYAVMLAPSLVMFLILSPRYRFWLKKPQPWLAAIVAALVFSPVIIWNSQNNWASFAFQTSRTVEQRGSVGGHVGLFWLAQLAVLTPVGLALLGAAAWRAVRRIREDAWNFAAAFSLPLFGLFTAASFKTAVHVNWTAPAFLALLPAASALWWDKADSRAWRTTTWIMAGLCAAVAVGGHFILATGKPAALAYSHAGGWRELAKEVAVVEREFAAETGQTPFIIGADKYNIAAELGFYLQRPELCVNSYAFGARGLGYRYWTDLNQWAGRPALVVLFGKKPQIERETQAHFTSAKEPRLLPLTTPGKKWRSAYVIEGLGYRLDAPPSADANLD